MKINHFPVHVKHFLEVELQGRPSQNGFFEFEFLSTSTSTSLVYLASNQQLLMEF